MEKTTKFLQATDYHTVTFTTPCIHCSGELYAGIGKRCSVCHGFGYVVYYKVVTTSGEVLSE